MAKETPPSPTALRGCSVEFFSQAAGTSIGKRGIVIASREDSGAWTWVSDEAKAEYAAAPPTRAPSVQFLSPSSRVIVRVTEQQATGSGGKLEWATLPAPRYMTPKLGVLRVQAPAKRGRKAG